MLLLNPGRVADGLRSGNLTEQSKARLLFSALSLSAFVSRRSILGYRTSGQLLEGAAVYALFLGGVWSCYRLNARLDNRRFVERYVCLSIPLWVWTVLGYLVPYYAAFYLLRVPLGLDAASYPDRVRPYALLYEVAVLPIYFLLLRHYFRRSATDLAARSPDVAADDRSGGSAA